MVSEVGPCSGRGRPKGRPYLFMLRSILTSKWLKATVFVLCLVPLGHLAWLALHRLIYGTAVAAVIHYYWLVKSDVHKPVRYGIIVAALLLYRAGVWLSRRRARAAPGRAVEVGVGT